MSRFAFFGLFALTLLAEGASPAPVRLATPRSSDASLRGPDDDACEALPLLPDVSITYAKMQASAPGVPAYCYVIGSIAGRIRFDMRLPVRASWNGKLVNIGGGGKDGLLKLGPIAPRGQLGGDRLAQGYAVASSNSGHDAGAEPSASFGEDLQAVIDFGFRAVHLTANASKAVTKAFYGKPPEHSYFEGCSTGGRQGLMEAQRYPEDFDGIVVGAPVLDYQAMAASHVWTLQRMFGDHLAGNLAFDKDGDGIPESLTKWQILRDAVLAKCDANDGIQDGIIDDPLACKFTPARDLAGKMCPRDTNADNCFTQHQLQTIQDIYRGPHDSKGTRILKGLSLGSEFAWPSAFIPSKGNNMSPGYLSVAGDHMNYLFYEHSPGAPPPVLNDVSQRLDKKATPPEFAWWEFRVNDVTAGKGKFMAAIMDATDPQLSRFLKRKGGKLIIYHGWGDATAHPESTVDYYRAVVAMTFGGDTSAARQRTRLFMVPGMGHCTGGPGCNTWDRLAPLAEWVEHDKAPDYIVAEHRTQSQVDNQRRLCPYPEHAVYVGPSGGENDRTNWVEKNFSCR